MESLFGEIEGQKPSEAVGTRSTVPVLMPVALDQTYDYLRPDELTALPGQFVLVPFGPQLRIGVVWDRPLGDAKPIDPKKMKALDAVLVDVPALPELSLRFAEWVAKYTLAPLGMVVRMMMGAQAVFEPVKQRTGVAIVKGATHPPRMTPARQRALDIAADGNVRPKSALASLAQCTTGVIDGLVGAGVLVEVAIPEKRFAQPDPKYATVAFRDAQNQAVETLRSAVDAANFSASLLDGVTGSGKTEVYFEAVARTLEAGRQALIMLPEIALTSQFMDRFQARFGCMPAEWHSALAPQERARVWRSAATGEARVIVGARSALFLPFADLGIIVVDEEHDQGFKQEDRVHYQGRDMAVVRANLGQIPVVLASATPSIESHVNARTGRYRHVVLPGRYSGTELPAITPIDLRSAQPDKGRWLAPPMVEAITETLAKGQQTLLFLNRRGYAPMTLCRCLRPSHRMPAMHRVAGRASFPQSAQLPPLRVLAADPRQVPEVQGREVDGRLRPRRRAHRRGGEGALSRSSTCIVVFRSDPRSHGDARGHQVDRERRGADHHRHPDRRQGPSLPEPRDRRYRRWRSRACRHPIRAPASVHSSSSIR